MTFVRRDGRAVDGGGLENRCTRKGIGGSNPSPSARNSTFLDKKPGIPCRRPTPRPTPKRGVGTSGRRSGSFLNPESTLVTRQHGFSLTHASLEVGARALL